ncbi:MAG TPA: amidohydrolase family protein [Acidimicrobiales bacterium]|jgi:imidazolonepropionase-like amidohydrolase
MKLFLADIVVTGVGRQVIDAGGVLVDDLGRIAAVGTAAELTALPGAADATLTDLGAATLLPGLIDSHVHLGFDGSEAPVQHMIDASDADLLIGMLAAARNLLAAGVTTARDLGARSKLDLAVLEAVETGQAPGPRLVVANEPITTGHGHCWFMGCEQDDRDGIRRAVREHAQAGATVIKVMATGGFMTEGSRPWDAQYGAQDLAVLVEEAHRQGRPVAAHAHGLAGIRNAVSAAVNTIEHCSWAAPDRVDYDSDVVAEIADRRIFVCPTTNLHALNPIRRPVSSMPVAEELITGRIDRLRRMREAGVRLVAGTDAGVNLVPHGAYAAGLEALAASGMAPLEVIECATSRAAEACGVDHLTGSLAPGLAADLVAVMGDATTDISRLRAPALIVSRGRRFDATAA